MLLRWTHMHVAVMEEGAAGRDGGDLSGSLPSPEALLDLEISLQHRAHSWYQPCIFWNCQAHLKHGAGKSTHQVLHCYGGYILGSVGRSDHVHLCGRTHRTVVRVLRLQPSVATVTLISYLLPLSLKCPSCKWG